MNDPYRPPTVDLSAAPDAASLAALKRWAWMEGVAWGAVAAPALVFGILAIVGAVVEGDLTEPAFLLGLGLLWIAGTAAGLLTLARLWVPWALREDPAVRDVTRVVARSFVVSSSVIFASSAGLVALLVVAVALAA